MLRYIYILFFVFNILNLNSKILVVSKLNEKAVEYVGNTKPINGIKQLELLINEGLNKEHFVLEIGCGALIAGIPIMSFLNAGHYVGIEPNKWLIDDSLKIKENAEIIKIKNPLFLFNSNFDASEVGIKFDYIISHSVMSHAPLNQLQLFLKNCSTVLNNGGKVIFSLRLTDVNIWDNLTEKQESTTTQWQYPGNTFFNFTTIEKEAAKYFKTISLRNDFRAIIMSSDCTAFHDWIMAVK